jgi:hypothetical protein
MSTLLWGVPARYARIMAWNPDVNPGGGTLSAHQLEERQLGIVSLRQKEHLTFETIGAQYGISGHRAREIYYKAMREIPIAEINAYRAEQLDRFAELRRAAYEILKADHPMVSQNGKVVIDPDSVTPDTPDGKPMQDAGPILSAIDRILAIDRQEAALLGLNAPAKHQIQVETVRYEVLGVDVGALLGPARPDEVIEGQLGNGPVGPPELPGGDDAE